MNSIESLRSDGLPVRTVEAGDGVEYVVDLGTESGGASVDVVGDTAIVVVDGDQHEISLPSGDAEAFIRNGVLTVRTEDSA